MEFWKVIPLVLIATGCTHNPVIKDPEPYNVPIPEAVFEDCPAVRKIETDSPNDFVALVVDLRKEYEKCSAKLDSAQEIFRKLENGQIIRITTPGSKGSMPKAEGTSQE